MVRLLQTVDRALCRSGETGPASWYPWFCVLVVMVGAPVAFWLGAR
jgi:hypothetical protein